MTPPRQHGATPPKSWPIHAPLTFMQLNFRKSETTWLLCHKEFIDSGHRPDVILVQDPPSSVMGGKNIFQGYRLVRASARGSMLGQVAILLRDSLRFRGLRPFGPRVVLVEIASEVGPIIVLSAYIRHSSGEGLTELEEALRWAKGRCPRVILGCDGNGHSSWWGPRFVTTNSVGARTMSCAHSHHILR